MAASAAVVARDLVKRYGTVEALRGASFSVDAGEMFALIGPDGAGKTTAIRIICGLTAPDAGSVAVFGLDPARARREASAHIGYLSQRFSLYGDLSVDENIAFFAEIHGVARYRQRRDELLAMMQLTRFRDRLAERLSGGMKQKLALACTLVHEPDLLVLDEPTTGVDPVSRREFWKLLSRFLDKGMTILMATPYLDEAERCSRVAFLHEGKVLALDAPAALRRSVLGDVLEVVAVPAREALRRLRDVPGVIEAVPFGERAHVRVAPDRTAEVEANLTRALAEAGVTVQSIRRRTPSLEDVFIEKAAQS